MSLVVLKMRLARPEGPFVPVPVSTNPDVLQSFATRLSPTRQTIVLELVIDNAMRAEWTLTAVDLGLMIDPEESLEIQAQVRPYATPIAALASAIETHAISMFGRGAVDLLKRLSTLPPALPPRVIDDLHAALDSTLDVLWVQFGNPAGYLPQLPWERMLMPVTAAPVLRLPYHMVDPVSTHTSLDVLLTCSGVGASKLSVDPARVVECARRIVGAVPADRRCMVHVFADAAYYGPLAVLLGGAAGTPDGVIEPPDGRGIVLYPRSLRDESASTVRVANPHEHPWAQWITLWLNGRAIDVQHVVADALMIRGEAYLAIAASPLADATDLSSAIRYINAADLRDFTFQVGGWATVASSTVEEVRRTERVLLDVLARLKPGVYAVHEVDADRQLAELGHLYELFVADSPTLPHRDATVALSIHPGRIRAGAWALRPEATIASALAAAQQTTRKIMDANPTTPDWVAASQRYLETAASASMDATAPNSPADAAARRGTDNALRFALDTFASSCDDYMGEGEGGKQ
jgi:hypothetical protein